MPLQPIGTKRKGTVETAIFGSDFVAARIVTDPIIDLRHTLMYLGVPIRSKSYMFGDNKSVVGSASIPTSTLSKKSTLASDYRQRSHCCRISSIQLERWKTNSADIMSKHWEFARIWPLLKPLLFWKGDTSELTTKTKGSDKIAAKRMVLSSTLMDQELIHSPNVTPRGYPMKLWCLFCR